eukprot:9092855-Pyramimonas_sp.AAC.1
MPPSKLQFKVVNCSGERLNKILLGRVQRSVQPLETREERALTGITWMLKWRFPNQRAFLPGYV